MDLDLIIYPLVAIILWIFSVIIDKKRTARLFFEEEVEKEIKKPKKPEKIQIPIGYTAEYSIFQDLKQLFECKKEVTIKLIKRKFNPDEMSYDYFMSNIETCDEVFEKILEEGMNVLLYSSAPKEKIERDFQEKFELLEQIIEKIDDLMNELIQNEEKVSKMDIEILLDDMNRLSESVIEYGSR